MKRATFTDGDGNPPPEQHLESLILDSISDAVMSIDGQWRFTYINSQAEALLGLPKERLLGSLVWGDYADSIGVELRPHCERAARTRTQVSFCSFYQPLHIWLAIHVYPHAQGVAVLMQDITHLKKQESQLQDLAQRDGLTNLPNRRMCQRTLETALAGIPSKRQNVSVLFVDIDLFKLVNDSYGHDAGDMVLVELARRFDALAGADAFVSRIRGDEFVFLLEGKSDVELGCFAELLLLTVARPITIREADVVVEASVGVARCPTPGNTPSDLCGNAK